MGLEANRALRFFRQAMWEGRRYLSEKMRASCLAFTFKSAEAADSGRQTGARRGLWPGRSSSPDAPSRLQRRQRPDPLGGRAHRPLVFGAPLPALQVGTRLHTPTSVRVSVPRLPWVFGPGWSREKSCPILLRLREQLGKSPRTPGA